MSDKLEIHINSEEIDRLVEEDLVYVPRQVWGKELRKTFSSKASDREKALALSSAADGLYPGSTLFEPRFSDQFKEAEGEVISGLPYSIHEGGSPHDIVHATVGLFRTVANDLPADDEWKYISSLSSSFPTDFTLSNDFWAFPNKTSSELNGYNFASFIFDPNEEGGGFKLIRGSASDIEGFLVHRYRSKISSLNLSEHALAQVFDAGRSLASYNEISFVLTGCFESPSVSTPAIDTGSGYARNAKVVIQLGTPSSPCFILGRGGDTAGNGGSALRLGDVAPNFVIVKGNSASRVGGGGGGGCRFQCLSSENKTGLVVLGGGGAGRGVVQESFSEQEGIKKKSARNKVFRASPSKSRIQEGKIKSISNNNEVEIFGSHHSLDNGSRVIISDITPGQNETYFIKSTGPTSFKLFTDPSLTTTPPDVTYSTQSCNVKTFNSVKGLEGVSAKIWGEEGYAAEIKTVDNPSFISEVGHVEQIIFDTALSDFPGVQGFPLAAVTTNIETSSSEITWTIGELTGNYGQNSWGGTLPVAHLFSPSSGRWSFIGREGHSALESTPLPGHKDILRSCNGGWYGEDGQSSFVAKIYDPQLYKSDPLKGFSQSEQLGGLAGHAIESCTTNVSGTAALTLNALESQNWVLGRVKTFNNSSNVYNSTIFDQLKDNADEHVQKDSATSTVAANILSDDPLLVGGVSFSKTEKTDDGSGYEVIGSSGLFS